MVYPAAGFSVIARRNGAKLIIINQEQTELDSLTDFVGYKDIGDVMAPLMDMRAEKLN